MPLSEWSARPRRIRHLQRATAPVQNETAPTYFGGAITALNDTSLTLHDGDRDLTCALDASSPSTAGFRLGQHVKVECAGGKLVAIAAITQADVGRYYVGTVNALDGKGLTLQTEHGPDHVHHRRRLTEHRRAEAGRQDRHGLQGVDDATRPDPEARRDGHDDASAVAPPATHTTTGARGAVSSIDSSALSVQTDGGTVTCQLGSSSPALGDLSVGEHVSITCLDGVLATLERLP